MEYCSVNKRKVITDTCNSVDESQKHYGVQKKQDTK